MKTIKKLTKKIVARMAGSTLMTPSCMIPVKL